MRKVKTALIGAAAAALLTTSFALANTASPSLTRKAQLGVALEAGDGGAQIKAVTPNATAAQMGLQAGDVITAVNGAPTPNPAQVVSAAQVLRAGDAVRLTFRRAGVEKTTQARASARPMERYTGATAAYGAVPFRGGLLRDILVTPTNPAPGAPVVFLIQGYTCATMEGEGHPYHQFAQGLATRGIATYRIEKPGMGDSQGGPACLESDFDVELDAFRTGLAALTRTYGVDPKRIVIFGHSMGGVQAPLLAAESGKLKGVAVMGTVVRNWQDYMLELFRVQSFFAKGDDPVEMEALSEEMRPLIDAIFEGNQSLRAIADANPEFAGLLHGVLQWNAEDQILARSLAYWRGVGRQRLAKAWSEVQAPVLTVYGEADFAAIDDRDHRLIVDIVNFYRPGTAQFKTLARTGHGFGLEGARDEARAANAKSGMGMNFAAPYNPDMHTALADWVLGLK